VLVGSKLDMREEKSVSNYLKEKGESPISTEMGLQMAQNIGAVRYCECSALTQKGVSQIFEEAARAGLRRLSSTENNKDSTKDLVGKRRYSFSKKCLIM